eukprot:gene10767-346_t
MGARAGAPDRSAAAPGAAPGPGDAPRDDPAAEPLRSAPRLALPGGVRPTRAGDGCEPAEPRRAGDWGWGTLAMARDEGGSRSGANYVGPTELDR